MIVIEGDHPRPYATNLAASVLADKMLLDKNAISVKEVTLASRTARAFEKRFLPAILKFEFFIYIGRVL